MGSFSVWHWLIVLIVLSGILFPLTSGLVMWVYYRVAAPESTPRLSVATSHKASTTVEQQLPILQPGQRLALEFIRDPKQRLYLPFVLVPSAILAIALVGLVFVDASIAIAVIIGLGVIALLLWISWRLLYVFVLGHSIRISEFQYPQLFRLIDEASKILGIGTPDAFIMQGHGSFETLVAKRFSKHGMIILTSNLVDDLTERGASRELMFFVGRQLGLMATGYFRFWFTKGILGRIALPFYLAWERRCHITADRIGLLVAGELHAAEQAMVTITAGSAVAPSTNIEALTAQRHEVLRTYWGWVALLGSSYPYMVDRILRLREFAAVATQTGIHGKKPVGALPLGHCRVRSLPILIIHGHDFASRLELENFLFKKFPQVAPVSMIVETAGAAALPEKFEELAARVSGAVALLTPDDIATTIRTGDSAARARQNVVIEIGWFWGRLGRNRCLLLMRDVVELPSDLSCVEVHKYKESPIERSEALRDFVESISVK